MKAKQLTILFHLVIVSSLFSLSLSTPWKRFSIISTVVVHGRFVATCARTLHKPSPFWVPCPFLMRLHISGKTLSEFQVSADIPLSETKVKSSNVLNFVWKKCIVIVVNFLKSYGFGDVSSTSCLRQISSNQKYLILQNQFQVGNSHSFPKVILHECQRLCKFV